MNCCVAPVGIEEFDGVTTIDCRVGATITIFNVLVAVEAGVAESLAWTVKLKVPAAAVGIPVMAPVLWSKLSPTGSVMPLANDQIYGVVPPLAANGGAE